MKTILLSLSVLLSLAVAAQEDNYTDSLQSFRIGYISTHEVVKDADRAKLTFFPINKTYYVATRFEQVTEAPWFKMETSGKTKRLYRVYGILHFTIAGKSLKLHIYQSKDLMNTEKYADHLFIPFTDETCGEESYENGRYIDLSIPELNSNFSLDFNKAYNPYCAYKSNTFECPIPPAENHLAVKIKAGEMKYAGGH